MMVYQGLMKAWLLLISACMLEQRCRCRFPPCAQGTSRYIAINLDTLPRQ